MAARRQRRSTGCGRRRGRAARRCSCRHRGAASRSRRTRQASRCSVPRATTTASMNSCDASSATSGVAVDLKQRLEPSAAAPRTPAGAVVSHVSVGGGQLTHLRKWCGATTTCQRGVSQSTKSLWVGRGMTCAIERRNEERASERDDDSSEQMTATAASQSREAKRVVMMRARRERECLSNDGSGGLGFEVRGERSSMMMKRSLRERSSSSGDGAGRDAYVVV